MLSSHLTVTAMPRLDELEATRRQTESPIELALLDALARRQPYTRLPAAQYVIRDELGEPVSRADFAYPDLKYAIYCDGRQWHLVEGRWQRDLRQRNKLVELGWVFSVFSGADILRNAGYCTGQIWKTLERLGGVASTVEHGGQTAQESRQEPDAVLKQKQSDSIIAELSEDSKRVFECLRAADEPLGPLLISVRSAVPENRRLDVAIADLLGRGLVVEVETERGKRYSLADGADP